MSKPKDFVPLPLTKAQEEKRVKEATGKDAESIELGVEELEERIAPFGAGTRGGI